MGVLRSRQSRLGERTLRSDLTRSATILSRHRNFKQSSCPEGGERNSRSARGSGNGVESIERRDRFVA
jgi:hypothetical protein